MALISVNPYNDKQVASYPKESISSAVKKVLGSKQASILWKKKDIYERIEIISSAIEILESNKEVWASLMTQEMGKLKSHGVAEIDKCKWLIEYYAEHACYFLETTDISTDYKKAMSVTNQWGPFYV